jgi:hypothetical protein
MCLMFIAWETSLNLEESFGRRLRWRAMTAGNPRLARLLSAALLVCLLMVIACCGGSGKPDPPAFGPLSGNWQMALQQGQPSTGTLAESGFLLQSGSTVSGNLALSDQTLCPGLGPAAGTLTGTHIAITVNQVGQTVTLTGTAAGDGSSMEGTYTLLASGCTGGSATGTWTASQVKPIAGTYLATFTSYTLSPYSSAVSVSQGANSGANLATLSGTITSSSAPCGSNLSIAGVVSGTSIVFNFLTSDGTAVGQFTGTTSTDGSTLTGTYDFLAENNVCAGDAGTISVIQQPAST